METCKSMFSLVQGASILAVFSCPAQFLLTSQQLGQSLRLEGHSSTIYTAQVDTYDEVKCGIEAASRRCSSALLCVYSMAATTTQEQLTKVQH